MVKMIKKRTKITLIVILSICILATLTFCGILIVADSIMDDIESMHNIPEKDLSYKKIIEDKAANGQKEMTLKEVFFDFEWDRAYIQTNRNSDYDKAFGYETGVDRIDIWFGDPRRIIFVDDDTKTCTYIYRYFQRHIEFYPIDSIVRKDDVFKVSKSNKIKLELIQ